MIDIKISRHAEIKRTVKEHDNSYYNQSVSNITDNEYDNLKIELKAIEAELPYLAQGSPTQSVGAKPTSRFPTEKHNKQMLSLENAFQSDDIVAFNNNITSSLNRDHETVIDYIGELKIDGMSLSLHYVNGYLEKALTRGDGDIGEIVTENAKCIQDIPHKLEGDYPEYVNIRGEVYIKKSEFKILNEKQKGSGRDPYSNPRNTASGTMRLLDTEEVKRRKLNFFPYAIAEISKGENYTRDLKTQKDDLIAIRLWGFNVEKNASLLKGKQALINYHEKIMKMREDLDYDIDGVVIKLNLKSAQQDIGQRSNTPKWAIAFKFPAERAETTLEAIDIQVGRTGALTPVARLKPVYVGGVTVTNVTLHNEAYIAGLNDKNEIIRENGDLRIGDVVIVQRAGDVIPQIVDINLSKRQQNSQKYNFPKHCPACSEPVVKLAGQAVTRCENTYGCTAQAVERLIHFASKAAMNMDGIGEKQIHHFYNSEDQNISVKEPFDLFTLKSRQERAGNPLMNEKGFGKTSVENIFNSIEKARSVPLNKFIYALGITQIGEGGSKRLAKHFKSYEALRIAAKSAIMPDSQNEHGNSSWQELINIEDVGTITAEEIVLFHQNEKNEKGIDKILIYVTPIHEKSEINTDSSISGKTIVFTGTLIKMTRTEAEETAEKLGAKASGSVSKKTDILVAGPNAGSKLEKAKALGIKIIDEETWIELTKI